MRPPKKPTKPKWEELEARLAAPPPEEIGPMSLERLLSAAHLGGLGISAAQRALLRAADGLVVRHLTPEEIRFHFGVEAAEFTPPERPKVVILRTGVRSGKSLIAAFAALLKSSLFCQFRRPPEHPDEVPGPDGMVGVRKGELVRALIVAPRLGLSRQPLHHLLGSMRASKALERYIHHAGVEFVELKRDDGAIVRVERVAASSGGLNLRSTWLAGVIFDEADFHDDDGAAVNLRENFEAVSTRVLSGGQVWVTSSPWDDSGEFHEMFTAAFGKPGRVLAFHSDSVSMNPTIDRADIAAARERDPIMAAREYDAVPLSSTSLGFFPLAAIRASCVLPYVVDEPDDLHRGRRVTVLQPNGAPHFGGTDLAYKKNSSALALSRRHDAGVGLAYYEEQVPTRDRPLIPKSVLRAFATKCFAYKCLSIRGDRIYASHVHGDLLEIRGDHDERLVYEECNADSASTTAFFTIFRGLMLDGVLKLPNEPRLVKMLEDTKTGRGANGNVTVILPKHGAAHADVLVAVVLSAIQVPIDERSSGPVGKVVGGVGGGFRGGGFGGGRGFG